MIKPIMTDEILDSIRRGINSPVYCIDFLDHKPFSQQFTTEQDVVQQDNFSLFEITESEQINEYTYIYMCCKETGLKHHCTIGDLQRLLTGFTIFFHRQKDAIVLFNELKTQMDKNKKDYEEILIEVSKKKDTNIFLQKRMQLIDQYLSPVLHSLIKRYY